MSDADFEADPSLYDARGPRGARRPEAERPIGGIAAGLPAPSRPASWPPARCGPTSGAGSARTAWPWSGLIFLVLLVLVAVFAPLIAPYGSDERTPGAFREPPSTEHWFGTDTIGLDVFSRVVYGARISLKVGLRRHRSSPW